MPRDPLPVLYDGVIERSVWPRSCARSDVGGKPCEASRPVGLFESAAFVLESSIKLPLQHSFGDDIGHRAEHGERNGKDDDINRRQSKDCGVDKVI
jgi:hypothetical protein